MLRKKSHHSNTNAQSTEKIKSHHSYEILCQPDSHELPSGVGWEKVSVGAADMRLRSGARYPAENVLVAHEFAVVLSQGPRCRGIPRIGRVAAPCPLPNITKHLRRFARGGRCSKRRHMVK